MNDEEKAGKANMEPVSPETGRDLFESVYSRLKAMAGRNLDRSSDESLNTTGLVHELYLRMSSGEELQFINQNQFFDYAAKAMRHILVDRSRSKLRVKRGGDLMQIDLDSDTTSFATITAERALEIDSALRKLEAVSPRAAKVVELHFFAGLPLEEVGEILGISLRTVNREWRFARAYLHTAT